MPELFFVKMTQPRNADAERGLSFNLSFIINLWRWSL